MTRASGLTFTCCMLVHGFLPSLAFQQKPPSFLSEWCQSFCMTRMRKEWTNQKQARHKHRWPHGCHTPLHTSPELLICEILCLLPSLAFIIQSTHLSMELWSLVRQPRLLVPGKATFVREESVCIRRDQWSGYTWVWKHGWFSEEKTHICQQWTVLPQRWCRRGSETKKENHSLQWSGYHCGHNYR